MPYCLALFGERGVGKTAIVRHWLHLARAQQAESLEEVQVPYLYASLPVHPTYKGLLTTWLDTFGDPAWKGGITANIEKRVRYFIKACHVQVLLIDDLEHLVLQESERYVYTFLDDLKRLITTTEISAVFIGRPEIAGALLCGSAHVKNFIEVVRFLQPFKWDRHRPATVREFCFLLRAIDQALPLDPSSLDDEDVAYRLFYATCGSPRKIFELICAAARKAVQTHSATIGNQLLAEAFDDYRPLVACGEIVNPFSTPGFHETR